MKLNLVKILEYYDVPQLLVAEDAVDVSYVCLLYEINQEGDLKYMGVRMSKSRLNDFIKGRIDLRTIYTNPEVENDYYSVSFVEDGSLVADQYKGVIVESMLPEEGYFYDEDFSEDQEMIENAAKNNHPVIHLAFETPDNRHDIDLRCFAAATTHFQSLVDNCYRKLYKNEDIENCQLRLTTFSAASFDVELVAEEELDLFGQSKVGQVLEVVNNLFSPTREEVVSTLRQFKGHTVNSYKKLIEVLLKNDISMNLKWVFSTYENCVHQNRVDKKYMKILHEIINAHGELMSEERSTEGVFEAADDNNGNWTFKPHETKSLRGTCEKHMLVGVVIKNKNYKIDYKSEQTINETTLLPTTKNKLLTFKEV